MKPVVEKIICWVCGIIISLCLLAFILPVFVCDRFHIKGVSMFPEYVDGDEVWVNKLLMGARIYKSFDFESPELESFRMPGFRDIRVGDVAVFNCPYGREHRKIEFRINYVYVKRCLGCPGDTIMIQDCRYLNTNYDKPFGCISSQAMLASTPDSLIAYETSVFPFSLNLGWTMREMGALLVPGKGITIEMDENHTRIYAQSIEYETGIKPRWEDGKCIHGESVLSSYTFTEDYLYFVGDNVLNSKDSRYFGFVPKDFVIGIVVN